MPKLLLQYNDTAGGAYSAPSDPLAGLRCVLCGKTETRGEWVGRNRLEVRYGGEEGERGKVR